MKTHLILILMVLCIPSYLSAQGAHEDVIYLKNGSIFRGVLIEQVPNVRYKIQIADTTILTVTADEVLRITSELKGNQPRSEPLDNETNTGHGRWRWLRDRDGWYMDKGYFFEAQFHADWGGLGVNIVNGYKINQYAILGAGIGIRHVITSANKTNLSYSGEYFPFFIYYAGEILKRKVVPFYTLSIGYALASNIFEISDPYGVSYNTARGGVTGGTGFGVRLYPRKRLAVSLSINLDVQHAYVKNYNYYGPSPPPGSAWLLMPSFKFGIGLVKGH